MRGHSGAASDRGLGLTPTLPLPPTVGTHTVHTQRADPCDTHALDCGAISYLTLTPKCSAGAGHPRPAVPTRVPRQDPCSTALDGHECQPSPQAHPLLQGRCIHRLDPGRRSPMLLPRDPTRPRRIADCCPTMPLVMLHMVYPSCCENSRRRRHLQVPVSHFGMCDRPEELAHHLQ